MSAAARGALFAGREALYSARAALGGSDGCEPTRAALQVIILAVEGAAAQLEADLKKDRASGREAGRDEEVGVEGSAGSVAQSIS